MSLASVLGTISMTMHILNCSKFSLKHNEGLKDTMWFLLTFEDKLLYHTQLFSQETIWHVALGRLLSPGNSAINMSILQLKTARAIHQNKVCESKRVGQPKKNTSSSSTRYFNALSHFRCITNCSRPIN